MHKVLVVEDEELIRTMIKINLQKAGYSVRCCRDAECMVTALSEEYFDLVLLDIMLPGMSGEEALVWIRAQKKQLPVIMVTARNGIETNCNALDVGADDYIGKHFNMK